MQDKTRLDKTVQEKTRRDKTRQDKTRRDETRQDLDQDDPKARWVSPCYLISANIFRVKVRVRVMIRIRVKVRVRVRVNDNGSCATCIQKTRHVIIYPDPSPNFNGSLS